MPLSHVMPGGHVIGHLETTRAHRCASVLAELGRALESFAIDFACAVLLEAQLAVVGQLTAAWLSSLPPDVAAIAREPGELVDVALVKFGLIWVVCEAENAYKQPQGFVSTRIRLGVGIHALLGRRRVILHGPSQTIHPARLVDGVRESSRIAQPPIRRRHWSVATAVCPSTRLWLGDLVTFGPQHGLVLPRPSHAVFLLEEVHIAPVVRARDPRMPSCDNHQTSTRDC
mmetsp:Transcript_21099/g.58967  ORF Transcript_21099/g.58967 Transcript_21099/m.58967 type:complete len:229 (+) Transcript_21099:932-1618(+)